MEWDERFALRGRTVRSSAIRELLKVTELPDTISFAGGLPAPELFPLALFREACIRVLGEIGPPALQYGSTEGYRPLREFVAARLRQRGMDFSADQVLITAGSQQALDLVGKLMIDPGDAVVIESPTYVGALQAFNMYGPSYLSVATDADGLRTDVLAKILRRRPKFIYVLPNFQNPSGATLSLKRRHELAEIADAFDVLIVEDDPYAELRFTDVTLPAITHLSQQLRGPDAPAIHLGTFSKTLSPGLRLGWIAGPREVVRKLVQLKQGTDLHTSTFTQMVAYEAARDGFIEKHVLEIRRVYHERMLAMSEALKKHFPPGTSWTEPQGGMFLWVTLPGHVDSREVLKVAVQNKVAFVPGNSFFPG